MFGFSLEFIGPDTAKGREMISLWQYEGFRHIFRIITASPSKIGDIARATLVLTHFEYCYIT